MVPNASKNYYKISHTVLARFIHIVILLFSLYVSQLYFLKYGCVLASEKWVVIHEVMSYVYNQLEMCI